MSSSPHLFSQMILHFYGKIIFHYTWTYNILLWVKHNNNNIYYVLSFVIICYSMKIDFKSWLLWKVSQWTSLCCCHWLHSPSRGLLDYMIVLIKFFEELFIRLYQLHCALRGSLPFTSCQRVVTISIIVLTGLK